MPKQEDYLYAAARVSALEVALLGREQYEKLITAPPGDMRRILADFGYPRNGEKSLSEQIERRVAQAFDTICEMAPDGAAFDALRYPYDASGLKAAIKCSLRSGFNAADFLSEIGSVSPEKTVQAVREGDYSVFPEHMRQAAPESVEAYVKGRDPSVIDRTIDRACFADMTDAAARSGIPELISYVRLLIDITNVLIGIRLLGGENAEIEKYMIPGGSVSYEKLAVCAATGNLQSELFRATMLSDIADELAGVTDAAFAERLLDDFRLSMIRPFKTSFFGAAPLIGYLLAYEAEARNLRIIAAGRDAGDAAEKIRERVRGAYV